MKEQLVPENVSKCLTVSLMLLKLKIGEAKLSDVPVLLCNAHTCKNDNASISVPSLSYMHINIHVGHGMFCCNF